MCLESDYGLMCKNNHFKPVLHKQAHEKSTNVCIFLQEPLSEWSPEYQDDALS